MTAEITLDTKFSCAEQILSSDIGDEFVMMSIDEGKYYSLKGPSGRVWDLIQNSANVQAIHAALLDEYDVEPEQCKEELIALLIEMHDNKLIEVDN